jgi:hypothetical protein
MLSVREGRRQKAFMQEAGVRRKKLLYFRL